MFGINRWEEVSLVIVYSILILRDIEEFRGKKRSSEWKVVICVDVVYGKVEIACRKVWYFCNFFINFKN